MLGDLMASRDYTLSSWDLTCLGKGECALEPRKDK